MTFIRVFCSVFKISTFAICIVKSSLIRHGSKPPADPRIATVSVIHGLCFATADLRWLSRKQRALEESSETCPILEDTDLFFAIFLSPCPLQTLLNEHSCFLRTPSSPPCGSHYGYIFFLNHLCVCTCVHLCIFLQKLNPELTFSERQTQSVSSNC